jgi:hypothetical protein
MQALYALEVKQAAPIHMVMVFNTTFSYFVVDSFIGR